MALLERSDAFRDSSLDTLAISVVFRSRMEDEKFEVKEEPPEGGGIASGPL